MDNNIHNPDQITWKEIGHLVLQKLKPRKEPVKESKDNLVTPEMFDRSHLHDWHNRTLADEPIIPEVEHYKNYIRMESAARKQRILETELQALKEEQKHKAKQRKRHKDSPKGHKTKYQSHKKRSRR